MLLHNCGGQDLTYLIFLALCHSGIVDLWWSTPHVPNLLSFVFLVLHICGGQDLTYLIFLALCHSGIVDLWWSTPNLTALCLAVLSPMSSYSSGIVYILVFYVT